MSARTSTCGGPAGGAAAAGAPRLWTLATVLALLAALVLAAAACGGEAGGGGGADESTSTATYSNSDHGFGLTYDAALTQGESGEGGSAGAVFHISFVDEAGPTAGGAYVDGLKVSVFQLTRPVKADEVPDLKAQVEDVVAGRLADLPAGKVTHPVSRTTVNGTPGFTVSYTFAEGDQTVSAVSTFLFSGARQYEVTGQASEKDWARLRPALEAAMASFSVDGPT